MAPRPAATVVVARPARPGFQLLLLERPGASRFAPGAFVFPGGALDEDDASPFWEARVPRTGERAACVAALRELFEETGIVRPRPEGAGMRPRLLEARRALLADEVLFSRLAQRLGLDFSSLAVVYFSRWITPRSSAIRFDTRFFLLSLEEETVEVSLTSEHERALWESPGRALRRFDAGELPMLFPTRKTLERLSGFESVKAALSALGEISVEPILARLGSRRGEGRPPMPGDPGYDEAY